MELLAYKGRRRKTIDFGITWLMHSQNRGVSPAILTPMSELAITRETLAHRGKRLEYFTIGWNSLEGLIGIVSGVVAGSISLIGFGIDSLIEVTSGAALLWRMSVDADVERRERSERLSLRIVGGCFLALASYVAYEAALDITRKSAPERSIPGIVLA